MKPRASRGGLEIGIVGKELRPADHAAGRDLDALGEGDGRATNPRKNGVEIGLGCIGGQGNASDREAMVSEARTEIVHDPQCSNTLLAVQEEYEYLQIANATHTCGMDVWPQRAKFRDRLKAYQDSTGKTQAETSADLGVELGSLRFWLYQKKRKPSFDTLQKAAALFRCSITDFIDDPGTPQAGIDQMAWSEVSERTRVLASAMFQDLLGLPEEEQEAYYQLWKQGVAIGRARMAVEAKGKKKGNP